MAKEITIWERLDNNTEIWEHNHIADGYDVSLLKPNGTPDQNKLWKGGTWRAVRATLTDDNEVIIWKDISESSQQSTISHKEN